jgi:hypothetical protein
MVRLVSELLRPSCEAVSFQARSLQPSNVLIGVADTRRDGSLVARVVLYFGERGLGLLPLFAMVFRQTAFLILTLTDQNS